MTEVNFSSKGSDMWKKAFELVLSIGETLPSNILIRKKFRDEFICYPKSKEYIYMSDVLCSIVMQGRLDDIYKNLDRNNFLQMSTETLACKLSLSNRIVRKAENNLIRFGLIEIRRFRGSENKIWVNLENLTTLIDDIEGSFTD